jgi:D-alanyl-D-alanine carboxypeptidase/D-alanyl-D-alanine-endopeptidase (penicillin-binding protein 4)
VNLTDGSGLSRSNTLTPETLVRVLVRMWATSAWEAASWLRCPSEGSTARCAAGCSASRRGRVLAKTGHIDGVSALAGYVEDTSEGPVAFAFIVNGSSRHRADRGLDDLCSILCAAPAASNAL